MPIKLNTEQFEQILFEELQEALLAEGRKDNVKKKYANLDKFGYIDHMSMEDPSGNNAYLAWMAKILNNMITKEPDMPLAHKEELLNHTVKAVRAFHGNKQRLKDKDINQYKTLPDLNKAIDALGVTSKDKRKAEREKALSEANIVFDNVDFFMVRPLTKESSCILGKHTKWCISSTKTRNYFNSYSSGEQDGSPRGFVFVRMANLDNDDDNKKMAIVYNTDGEVEDIFDAPDKSVGADAFQWAVQENIIKGSISSETRAGGILNYINRVEDISDRARPTDEELMLIAKRLNDEYVEMLVNDELVPTDRDEENWQNDTIDAIKSNLDHIADDLLYHIGSYEIMQNPPGLDSSVWDDMVDEANRNLQHISVWVEDMGYDDGGLYFSANMSFDIEGLKDIDEIDESNINEAVEEVMNQNAGFYTTDYDGVSTTAIGDELEVSININVDDYGKGPDGLETLITDLEAYDANVEDYKNAIIEEFEERGWVGGEGRTKSLDIVAYLEQTLKNFDEIEFEDNEINSYAQIKVQLPRVPKLIQDVSRQMGTTDNPGPLHYLKDNMTGPARGRNETLLDYMQMTAKTRLKSGQARQSFKSAVHRVFAAAVEYADGQEMLDLKEEENPYIMADVNFSIIHASEVYEPVSGKSQATFYVEFKARSDPEWNIKFMEMADKYFRAIEDAYELVMSSELKGYFDRELGELEALLRRDKEAKAKIAQQTAIDAERKSWADAMNEHFNNWRRFLK